MGEGPFILKCEKNGKVFYLLCGNVANNRPPTRGNERKAGKK